MNMPELTARQSISHKSDQYYLSTSHADMGDGVEMMASIGCIGKCVGATSAIKCTIECGNDMDCWAKCAGKKSVDCVKSCFKK